MAVAAGVRSTPSLIVINNADTGPGSLREVIHRANALSGVAVACITFNLPRDQWSIRPLSPLPPITRTVSIDARTQPGWKGNPIVELDGSLAGTTVDLTARDGLLTLEGITDCLVAGLVFNRYSGNGLSLGGGGGHRVVNCYFGTGVDGATAQPNRLNGCLLRGCSNSIIGGAAPEDRCLAAGNILYGILIRKPSASGNRIVGCYVGLDQTGERSIPNTRSGILVFNAPSNTIGGLLPGEGNVISGGARFGINVDGSTDPGDPDNPGYGKGHCHHNLIIGNLIGTTKTGREALGNGMSGVLICRSQRNTVGGLKAGARNIIAGNGDDGVLILGNIPDFTNEDLVPESNRIVGNYIGLTSEGRPLPNGRMGVTISKGRNNLIQKNVIRFNRARGVEVQGLGAETNRIAEDNVITDNLGKIQTHIKR